MRSASWSEFRAAPHGACYLQPTQAVWMWDERIGGCSIWGPVDESDAVRFFELMDGVFEHSRQPFDWIFDSSQMSLGDLDLASIARTLTEMRPRLEPAARLFRRQIVVHSDNLVGRVLVSLNRVLGAMYKWSAVSSYREALELSGHPDAGAIEAFLVGLPARGREEAAIRVAVMRVLERNPALDLQGIAQRVGLSTRSLQRKLMHEGTSLKGLQLEVRLGRARALLADDKLKVAAVAEAVGFSSVAHFNRIYRASFGVTPSQDRGPRR